MKRPALLLVLIFTLILSASSQDSYLPYADLKTLDGENVNSKDILADDAINIVVFWKSCNQKCCQSLDEMHEIWLDSLKDEGVNMICICIDGIGSWSHVKPVIDGNCWEFDTYVDVNCDLKRGMGVTSVPCTILIDASKNLICRYNGFCTGADKMMCEKIRDHSIAISE